MDFLKRLLGTKEDTPYAQPARGQYNQVRGAGVQQSATAREQATREFGLGNSPQSLSDEQALARYRYMLSTAPPEAIEQAHEEAFAKLTPEQRSMGLRELANTLPANEQGSAAYQQDDPRTLARMATRAEMRQPGTLERVFGGRGSMGGMGGGMGMGGMAMGMGGMILSSLAAGFVGSMIAEQFFNNADNFANFDGGFEGDQVDQVGMDEGYDTGGFEDSGGFEDTGGDFGGDFGGEF